MTAWQVRSIVAKVAIAIAVIAIAGVMGGSHDARAAPLASCTPLAGTNWSTAVWSCGHVPTTADTVTIPAGMTLSVTGAAEAGTLTLATSGTRLALGSGATLSIAGTLAATPSDPYASLITGSGWLRFVGGSRDLFSTNWAATTIGWRMEFALDEGAIGTTARSIKASEFRFTSGAVHTTGDIRPDTGLDNTGVLTIAAGAVLSTTGNIERLGTAGTQAASIAVSGTLITGGSRLSANTITIHDGGNLHVRRATGLGIAGALSYAQGATLTYAGTGGQTTGGELTASVGGLAVENTAGVALGKTVTVTGDLALTAGSLVAGVYTVTLGSAATCSGNGDVLGTVQRSAPGLNTPACFGHPDIRLTFTSGTPPAVAAVTVTPGATPFTGAVQRAYTITAPGFAGTATLRLHYLASELNGNDSANLRLWRNGGDRWEVVGRSSGDAGAVEVTGVTAFSAWALAEHGSTTAATLAHFTARRVAEGVEVTWSTATETLNAGFRLYRGRELYAPPALLHDGLIPAHGEGATQGYDYVYVDTSGDLRGPLYYWIEDVDLAGVATRHGPALVRNDTIYLPFVAP